MISLEELFESGVHFGHRVNRWNPKMAEFIFGELNGIHIIDLFQTQVAIEKVTQFLSKLSSEQTSNIGAKRANDGIKKPLSVLFVGTKKQIAGRIAWHADSISGHYVNHRWLGGLLTNWSTMKTCISKYKQLESQILVPTLGPQANLKESKMEDRTEEFAGIESTKFASPSLLQNSTKKERALQLRTYEKMKKFFGGIKNMNDIPEIVIVVGQDSEMNAVRECQKCSTLNTLSASRLRSENSARNGRLNLSSERNGKDSHLSGIRNSVIGFPRTITLLDTNCDPSEADLFIPANDDSPKSVDCILGCLTSSLRLN